MPGSKIILVSGHLQYIFGIIPPNEILDINNNISSSPFVHDIQQFPGIFACTDFIDNSI